MSQKQQVKGLLEKIQEGLEELAGGDLSSVFEMAFTNLNAMSEIELAQNLEGHHLDIKEKLLDEVINGRSTKDNK